MLNMASKVSVLLAILFCIPGSLFASDAELDQSIAEHRMGTLTILARPGSEVHVEQIRHEFWFGAAIAAAPFSWKRKTPDAAKYKEVFLKNFNAAVTENALKWCNMEKTQGDVNHKVVDAMLAWAEGNELPVRGHNIYWGKSWTEKYGVPKWQKQLNDEELLRAVKERATSIARRYKGRFAEYDLNNEMMYGNFYEDRLGRDITKQMADWVLKEDPEATLYLNDFGVLTGGRLKKFVAHVKNLQERGVPIGGIGLQGHSHRETFKRNALKNSLEVLAKLDLPIRITEFNMPGQHSRFDKNRQLRMTKEEEEAKARELVDYYRICFAQPKVKGIMMWGFWEDANWIPASAIYRSDWSPTPAAHAYRNLVFKEWWTDQKSKADDTGKCEVRAFYGKHRVTVGSKSKVVELKSDAKEGLEVEFTKRRYTKKPPRPTPEPSSTVRRPRTPVAERTDEEKAKGLLGMARNFLKNGVRSLAKKNLEEILRDYPDTDSAAEARLLLNGL